MENLIIYICIFVCFIILYNVWNDRKQQREENKAFEAKLKRRKEMGHMVKMTASTTTPKFKDDTHISQAINEILNNDISVK